MTSREPWAATSVLRQALEEALAGYDTDDACDADPDAQPVRAVEPDPLVEPVWVVEPDRLVKPDRSARSDRPHHLPNDRERVGDVLQEVSRVGEVEGPPLLSPERQGAGLSLSLVEQRLLAVGPRQATRLGALLGAAFDAHHRPAGRPRHGPGELPEAAADVEDPLPAAQLELAKRPRV